MKRSIPVLAIVFGCATAAWAAAPATLTTLRAIHALSNADAGKALPVAFEATVTFYRRQILNLVVQDSGVAIYVEASTDANLVPGDRVLVRGQTQDSYRPIVVSSDVTLLHHGALPKSVPANWDEMVRGELDCMRVSVHAIIRSAHLEFSAHERVTNLQLLMDGGYVEAFVNSSDPSLLKELLDADVEVTGVVSGMFDGKRQLTGIALNVPALSDVRIVKRVDADVESLSVTPMDQVLAGYHVHDLTRRVRVQGTITYYHPGSAVVLQSGSKSLWIVTKTDEPLRIGDLVDASGFPDVTGGFLTLTRSEIRDTLFQAPITPRPVTYWDLGSGSNAFDLISAEGQVLMAVRGAVQDEYVLIADGHLFSAIYRHPDGVDDAHLPPMKQVPIGSKVRVTGICMLYSSDPLNGPVAFDLLLRSSDDVTLVAKPSWLSIRNLILLVGLLLLVVIVVGTRSWTLERKVRKQTSALAARIEAEAALERRRSRILEDINGSRPLDEIINQITEMVSFSLQGAPSWCEISAGARLGTYPPDMDVLRIIRAEIPARSGLLLGMLYAGLDSLKPTAGDETETLSLGARLATLAIETRKLYSELRHRSEFDLLTDIHNRFSLDKRLEEVIDEARQNSDIFGLIYIDLDEFKRVNDVYGHRVGDLYLQEVALRMKLQLRSGDMLARLGGDEFAALIAVVRTRADVDEIAQRLLQIFDQPFAVEGYVLHGGASVGVALYPEDGVNTDSLLCAADAAMYVAKHTRRQVSEIPGLLSEPGITPEDRA
jgi:diguanylate cyclase (GGDEF)-like protein